MAWLPVVSDFLGLLGSLLLVAPALKASSYMVTLEKVQQAVDGGPDDRHDPGEALLEILKGHQDQWSPLDHGLLIAGVVLLCLSFALSLVVSFNAPC